MDITFFNASHGSQTLRVSSHDSIQDLIHLLPYLTLPSVEASRPLDKVYAIEAGYQVLLSWQDPREISAYEALDEPLVQWANNYRLNLRIAVYADVAAFKEKWPNLTPVPMAD